MNRHIPSHPDNACHRRTRKWTSVLLANFVAVVLIGFTSCPNPIDRNLVLFAEDDLIPQIEISSPKSNTYYYSVVNVTGKVSDSAVDPGDNIGAISKLSYSVMDRSGLSGDIPFDSEDGAFEFTFLTIGLSGNQILVISAEDWNGNSTQVNITLVDPMIGPGITITSPIDSSYYASNAVVQGEVANAAEVGSLSYEVLGTVLQGDITYDVGTGAYSFNFSTIELTGTIVVRIIAVDKNGRISTNRLSLLDDGVGPYINIIEPLDQETYLSGTVVNISGMIGNSAADPTVTEVQSDSLYYKFANKDYEQFTYTYDPVSGNYTFVTAVSTFGIHGPLVIKVKAEDLNGHVTENIVTLQDDDVGPDISISTPDPSKTLYYRSTVPSTIDCEGTVTADVQSMIYQIEWPSGEIIRAQPITAIDPEDPINAPGIRAFSFGFSTGGTPALPSDPDTLIKLKVISFDGANENSTSINMMNDITAPTPTITSLDPLTSSPFTASINFGEAVTGFALGDITVGNGSASNLAGGTAVYTAEITPIYGGTVTVDVAAGVAADGAGNQNVAAPQLSRIYDNGTDPVPTISTTEPDPTNSATFTVTIGFDELVSEFTGGDITVGNGSASNFTETAASREWTASITPSSDGPVTVDVGAGVVQDGTGNWNVAASQLSREYDGTAPAPVISSTAVDPTNASTIPVQIDFGEPVSGFDPATEITVSNGSGSWSSVDNTVWTAEITPSSDGPVTVDVGANVVQDAAGNWSVAATQFSIESDRTSPLLTISSTEPDPTNSASFVVTLSFDEAVSGFALGEITVGNGTASNLAGGPAIYTAEIIPSSDGPVTVDVGANVAQDAAGNWNVAASQLSREYDGTAPAPAISSIEPDPTTNTSFSVTINFGEDVTDFALGDITVGNGSASNLAGGTAIYTAEITASYGGTVTVDVAAGVVQDTATNANLASNQLSRIYDNGTDPVPTISSSESGNTTLSPFTVTIGFDELVSGFTVGDITVGNGSASNFTETAANREWTASITPDYGGTVTVDVGAGVTQDEMTNANVAASQFSIIYDNGTAPTPTITTTVTSNPTSTNPIPITIDFDEHIQNFGSDDVVVVNATKSNFATVTPMQYTLDLTPTSDGVTITADINSDRCSDLTGNNNNQATQFSIGYSSVAPKSLGMVLSPSRVSNSNPMIKNQTHSLFSPGIRISRVTRKISMPSTQNLPKRTDADNSRQIVVHIENTDRQQSGAVNYAPVAVPAGRNTPDRSISPATMYTPAKRIASAADELVDPVEEETSVIAIESEWADKKVLDVSQPYPVPVNDTLKYSSDLNSRISLTPEETNHMTVDQNLQTTIEGSDRTNLLVLRSLLVLLGSIALGLLILRREIFGSRRD